MLAEFPSLFGSWPNSPCLWLPASSSLLTASVYRLAMQPQAALFGCFSAATWPPNSAKNMKNKNNNNNNKKRAIR